MLFRSVPTTASETKTPSRTPFFIARQITSVNVRAHCYAYLGVYGDAVAGWTSLWPKSVRLAARFSTSAPVRHHVIGVRAAHDAIYDAIGGVLAIPSARRIRVKSTCGNESPTEGRHTQSCHDPPFRGTLPLNLSHVSLSCVRNDF